MTEVQEEILENVTLTKQAAERLLQSSPHSSGCRLRDRAPGPGDARRDEDA